ncbi:MAG: hypothetical protein HDQ99_02805 [Lachnospiraceae bacterium]|nr:hypothetical protein [Lachnospiraceae bacterium]
MDEFAIEWTKGSNYAGVTVPSGTALKSKLLRLAERNPNEVKIMAENEDGSLFAHIPVRYIKLSPPKKMSDEQKEAASERFRQMWESKREREE